MFFLLRFALKAFAHLIVGIYAVLDLAARPILGPVAALLQRLPFIEWCRMLARRLPPYGALAFLALPFAVAEPAKIYGLYLIGQEKICRGSGTIVVAYLVSLLLVDSIYEAAKPQLRTIGWFANLVDWALQLRDKTLAAVRASAAWRLTRVWVRIFRLRRRGLKNA